MYRIKLYNQISEKGLQLFNEEYCVGENIEDADGILVRSANLHDMLLPESVRAIVRAGAGTNNIPVDVCSEKGIVVFNTPGANANAVKELVLSGLLLCSRPILEAYDWLKEQSGENISILVEKEKKRFKGSELSGKTLGVIGLGAIGIEVANMALHLGMKVIGYDPYLKIYSAWKLSRHVQLSKSLDELYRDSDYITVHVPFMKETKHMIDADAISKMIDGVTILNFARGGLVDEEAVSTALESGKIKRYVVDFPSELMLGQKGAICIPHLGASTYESEENCALMAVRQLMNYLENGNIENAVNLPNISMDRSEGVRITCFHRNVPNLLAQISQIVSSQSLNIANMMNKSKGEYAYTIIDLDDYHIGDIVERLMKIPEMLKVQMYE